MKSPTDLARSLEEGAHSQAVVGDYSWDIASDTSAWSAPFYRILGLTPDEVAPSLAAFAAVVHPDDRAAWESKVEREVQASGAEPVVVRIIRSDGEVRYVRVTSLAVRDSDGRALSITGALADLTDAMEADQERKRRDEIFARAQRLAKIGIFEWDPETGALFWSTGLYHICGLSPDATPSHELYFNLTHPEDRPLLEALQLDVQNGEDTSGIEHRIVRPDGRVIDVYASASVYIDEANGRRVITGSILDITARKRVEAQLREGAKMDALGRLAGGIAHEFNNLLTVIGGHVDLLRRRHHSPSFDDITLAVQRAGQLTRSLLSFSRQATLEDKRINPVDAVREALSSLSPSLGGEVELELIAPSPVGDVALCTGDVEQLLLNLLLNARDALPEGGHVTVRLERAHIATIYRATAPVLMPGDYVLISIADDGVGMNEESLRCALEPFFTTKAPGQATGLGLSMVFSIVGQAGGGMLIDSREGVGTTVRLYVPELSAAGPNPDLNGGVTALNGTLLVVDDDPSLRSLLSLLLESEGIKAHIADGGATALAYFNAHRGEVVAVVTDVIMPEMTGVELVRHLRALCPNLPALYLSGYAKAHTADDDEQAIRGGFLMKPFRPEELIERVEELFELAAATRTTAAIHPQ